MPLHYLASDIAQRIGYHNPLTRVRSRLDGVCVERVVHLIGLKRSGLHAIANWLLGMTPRAALLNNSPMKTLGFDAPMSRTLSRSPLPIYLYRGHSAITLHNEGEEREARLEHGLPLVVVLWQSQSLSHLSTPCLLQGMRAPRTDHILLLRDPFNWLASVCAKAASQHQARDFIAHWLSYAREFCGESAFFPGATMINYNRWLGDGEHRSTLSVSLGLSGDEQHLQSVTFHAGGSSFDGTQFHGRAHDMQLTSRWRHFMGDKEYCRALMDQPEALTRALALFDLPDDLTHFAEGLLSTEE